MRNIIAKNYKSGENNNPPADNPASARLHADAEKVIKDNLKIHRKL
jgi:hypothetical protein